MIRSSAFLNFLDLDYFQTKSIQEFTFLLTFCESENFNYHTVWDDFHATQCHPVWHGIAPNQLKELLTDGVKLSLSLVFVCVFVDG